MLSVRKMKSARKSLPAFFLFMGTHEASHHTEPRPAPRGDEARREGYGSYQTGPAAAAPGDRRGDLREADGCPAGIAIHQFPLSGASWELCLRLLELHDRNYSFPAGMRNLPTCALTGSEPPDLMPQRAAPSHPE